MTNLELLQIGGAVTALGLQLYSTYLTQGIRKLVPRRLFVVLNTLMVVETLRRVMSVLTILGLFTGAPYRAASVIIGLCISGALLATVLHLRRHSVQQRRDICELASATVKLAHDARAEHTLAYQLAVHFIHARECRECQDKVLGQG